MLLEDSHSASVAFNVDHLFCEAESLERRQTSKLHDQANSETETKTLNCMATLIIGGGPQTRIILPAE